MSVSVVSTGAPPPSMELRGLAALTRFALHRDRVRILVWTASIVALVVLSAASVKGLYPTQADLDKAAAAVEGNAAAIALNGPAQGLDTLGGEVAFNTGAIGLVVVGLMSLLMVGRLTRGEEEAGRLELIRSLPIGAGAPTVAASLLVAAMNLVLGLVVTLSLLAMSLPVTGSLVFGLSFVLFGWLFVCVTLFAAQVFENTRVVYGATGALLGASFIVRAIGDIGDGTISWLSPIGWAQKTRPYAGEAWWPFLVIVGFGVVCLVVARRLASRRDLGAGLVAPRRGHRTASPSLGHPLGLAVRLQRGSLVGWGLGVLLTAISYGSIVDSVDDFVKDNKAMEDILARAGGSLTDSYIATSMRILALGAGGFVLQSTLRLRSEETQLHAEPVLATPVSRARWASSHLMVAALGGAALLAVAGVAMGVCYGIVSGDLGVVPGLIADAIVYVPAVWVLLAFGFALEGLAPRAVNVAWGALTLCFVVALLGQLLDLPRWVVDVSPFEHIPLLPAKEFTAVPIVALLVAAAALGWAGIVGLRRRDIG